MGKIRSNDQLIGLLNELCKQPVETEWLEFKRSKEKPDEIGEYISAIANSAALAGKQCGYVVWGVDDTTHAVVGTNFTPHSTRKGNEQLTNWLYRLLSPAVEFAFHLVVHEGKALVVLEI